MSIIEKWEDPWTCLSYLNLLGWFKAKTRKSWLILEQTCCQLLPVWASEHFLWNWPRTPWWSSSAWDAQSCWTGSWSGPHLSGSPEVCAPSHTAGELSALLPLEWTSSNTPQNPLARSAGQALHTHTRTERQTDRHRQRQRHTYTHTHAHTHTHTHTHTERERERESLGQLSL